ncbi:MAG TPA: rhomboid family intramembrane serine protease [Acidimicrobiia bacterium]|nr:rhomboid family intramembrane serine protease [Acidimicrobiia bacterium]
MVLPLRDLNPAKRLPIITLAIIAINVFVYFAIQPHSTTAKSNEFVYDHAVIPCELLHGRPLSEVQIALQKCSVPDRDIVLRAPDGGLERATTREFAPHKNVYLAVLASMFLHASLLHLGGNMLFLWIFGNNVEDHLGRFKYALFYLIAGVISALGFIVVNPSSVAPLIGASGAIAGVMGAYLIWFPRARVLTITFFIPVYLPAALVLGIWFVTQFFTDPNSGVAWVAHVVGFGFGMLVALALRDTHGPRSRRIPPPPPLPGTWPGGLRGFE